MLPRRLLGHRVVGRRRHLQVGVIGHGNMGRGVAASLARAGHDVVVFDADGAQTLRRPSTITAVDSVAAACRRADAVLLSLPHEAAERAVVADLLEARPPLVLNCAEIKILWRVRAESSRRPPTPSTRRLLDGLAVPVNHHDGASTAASSPRRTG